MTDQVAEPQVPVEEPAPVTPVVDPQAPVEPPQEPVAEETVSISRNEYNQMLTGIANMQTYINQMNTQQPQQPATPATQEPQAQDLDSMSNTELVGFFQQQQQPMLQTVMGMAVQMELNEVKGKYSDFDSVHKDVYAMAHANPSLSIEQAYLICKSQKPAPGTPPVVEVPKTNKPAPPPAQRTTTPAVLAKENPVLTARQAAIEAAKELGIE